MGPWLQLRFADLIAERPNSSDDNVHFTESFVETVLGAYTSPADVVLDPFAGSGTTLAVAKRLGRRAIGIELNPDYVELIKERCAQAEPPAFEEAV